MKFLLASICACFLICALLLPLAVHPPLARAQATLGMAPGSNFNCSSEDGRRKYCPTNTAGGVQLVKQRSGSPCTFGQTWGYDRRGVWVDRGCRADFAIGFVGGAPGNPAWPGFGQNYNVYCASETGRRQHCPVDTRGGVRLVRKRSDAACVYGASWGYEARGIWVDRGCRADFEIGQAGWQPGGAQIVTCSSDNMQRNYCRAETRIPPRIIRQRSDADCVYGRTWGYDPRGIWVDRGCRADFELGVRR